MLIHGNAQRQDEYSLLLPLLHLRFSHAYLSLAPRTVFSTLSLLFSTQPNSSRILSDNLNHISSGEYNKCLGHSFALHPYALIRTLGDHYWTIHHHSPRADLELVSVS